MDGNGPKFIEPIMKASLCALPNELLFNIVHFIEDRKALSALARVSRRYQNFAEAALYRTALIRNSNQAVQLRQALQKRPERAGWIQYINLRPGWYQPRKTLGSHMFYIISRCQNLRAFATESPTCNYGRWASGEDAWRQDEQSILKGLHVLDPRRLNKLTLHLDGQQQRYWDPNYLGSAHHSWGLVMALPSMVELTISCALIHDNIVTAESRSTNLRVLELIECNITLQGLKNMLAAPKALRKLHLGENAYHASQGYNLIRDQRYNSLFGYDPTTFIEALAQQSSSLENLEYISGEPNFPSKTINRTFEDFVKLQEVHLSEHARDNCRELILSGAPALRYMYLEIAALKLFEPVIHLEEEQKVGAGKVDYDLVQKRLKSKVASALFAELPKTAHASLRNLHIIMPHGPVPISGSRRTWIEMLSQYWKKRGVRFNLYYKQRTSIFPPILYDEGKRAPRDVLLYEPQHRFTEAANASDPWGFDGDYGFEFGDNVGDVLADFDFDAFLHGTEDDWNAFGDLDFQASFGL